MTEEEHTAVSCLIALSRNRRPHFPFRSNSFSARLGLLLSSLRDFVNSSERTSATQSASCAWIVLKTTCACLACTCASVKIAPLTSIPPRPSAPCVPKRSNGSKRSSPEQRLPCEISRSRVSEQKVFLRVGTAKQLVASARLFGGCARA